MSGQEPKVSTYREFADEVLPRIKACNYNAIQLMALQRLSGEGRGANTQQNFGGSKMS